MYICQDCPCRPRADLEPPKGLVLALGFRVESVVGLAWADVQGWNWPHRSFCADLHIGGAIYSIYHITRIAKLWLFDATLKTWHPNQSCVLFFPPILSRLFICEFLVFLSHSSLSPMIFFFFIAGVVLYPLRTVLIEQLFFPKFSPFFFFPKKNRKSRNSR